MPCWSSKGEGATTQATALSTALACGLALPSLLRLPKRSGGQGRGRVGNRVIYFFFQIPF
ncbi:MAG: hypothetical protein B6D64_05075 [Bacteroidetes bacterium 4484_276]|nr:MAG: hypothetical protein B6D64_05075 [Bacteroidetes bacterium 4484_276]